MHFPLPGAGFKVFIVFILGLVSFACISARPLTNSESNLISRSDLVSRARWTATVSFPGSASKILPSKIACNIKNDIRKAISMNIVSGHTVKVKFSQLVPEFDENQNISFLITWDNGAQSGPSKGVVKKIPEGRNQFRVEVELSPPDSTPAINASG
ncbi:uncharacterized protein C8R40DRAFT_59013 [Lentinula edodes]|uniref:uncharacterized protein n=1 Tax=Lentinula edodes TaxID=5353 RepID=UPI001E8E0B06|nr:uncharacterized protein C8R40DRAFT_59013 [Lentinula edodes]KAH7881663.1 hypothetical protein C8R40DRAFT_59013 [Lentinula edodes]